MDYISLCFSEIVVLPKFTVSSHNIAKDGKIMILSLMFLVHGNANQDCVSFAIHG